MSFKKVKENLTLQNLLIYREIVILEKCFNVVVATFLVLHLMYMVIGQVICALVLFRSNVGIVIKLFFIMAIIDAAIITMSVYGFCGVVRSITILQNV